MKKSTFKKILFTLLAILFVSVPASLLLAQTSVDLTMPIPGLPSTITLCSKEGEILKCDGIAKYIVALYEWLIAFTIILAVIALMFGGAIWILAGGSEKRVGQAQGVIKNSLVGLLIALFSYLGLWTISPNLVQFRPLRILQVEKIEINLEEFKGIKPDPEGGKTHQVKRIILHHSGGSDAQAGCGLVTREGGYTVDCHYWIKTTGEVVGPCVKESISSKFCTGGANNGSIGIEIVGSGQSFTPAQINSAATLVSDISSRWNIPKDNKSTTLEEFRNKGGVFTHASVCALSPGDSIGKWDILEKFQKEIIEKIDGTFYESQPRCS
ncbi:N-acetylmuramoyl-L-alanine amidase [Candidatus Uhrbacteria bacterium]|nr:N-acetylmuramoyl-L-alanine amidase [Candidatus Uhrbacteria bacterium]